LPVLPPNRFAQAHLILMYLLVASLVIWMLTGFYQVQAGEVAIVERLGQYVTDPSGHVEQVSTGLHWHLPWPIDRVHVVSTQQQMTLTVKAFNTSPAEYDDFKRAYMKDENNPFAGNQMAMDAIFNPYLITGDKSVVQMEMSVTFQVRDPELWLQSISHEYSATYSPDAKDDLRNMLLQDIAQESMIEQTGKLNFDEVLLEKRDKLPDYLKDLVSRETVIHTTDGTDPTKPADIDLGVNIFRVQVTTVHPPTAIQGFYDRVINENVGRQSAITNARAQADNLKQQATAESQTLKVDAEAYKNAVTQRAIGEAERFRKLWEQYQQSPELTRYNIYLDTVTAITGNAKRIMFVQPGATVYYTIDPSEYDPNQVRTATRP